MRAAAKESDDTPPARPAWISNNLVAETLRVLQPRYPETLTEDEAVEILMNVGELFDFAVGRPAATQGTAGR